MIVTVVAAASILSLDASISYETRGKDVLSIVQELSRRTGLKLQTRGLRDWPLILRFTNKPIPVILDKIAELTDSVWVVEDGVRVLSRTESRVRAAARAGDIDRGLRLRASLRLAENATEWTDAQVEEAVRQDLRKVDSSWSRLPGVKSIVSNSSVTPAKILLDEFFRQAPAAAFGGVAANTIRVYSTKPSGDELPMPSRLDGGMKAYLATRAKFASLMLSKPFFNGESHVYSNSRFSVRELMGSPVIKVQLMRPWNSEGLDATILISTDRLVDLYGESIELAKPQHRALPLLSGQIKLTEQSAALLPNPHNTRFVGILKTKDWSTQIHDFYQPKPKPEVEKLVRNPVKFEPHSFFVSDAFRSAADELGTDLAVSIADGQFNDIQNQIWLSKDLGRFWRRLNTWELGARVEDGILTVKPNNFGISDRSRINRTALARFMSKFGSSSLPTVDDFSQYAATRPVPEIHTSMDNRWMALLDTTGVLTTYPTIAVGAFWESLSKQQKQASTLRPEDLSGEQHRLLSRGMNFEGIYEPVNRSLWGTTGTEIQDPGLRQPFRFREGALAMEPRLEQFYAIELDQDRRAMMSEYALAARLAIQEKVPSLSVIRTVRPVTVTTYLFIIRYGGYFQRENAIRGYESFPTEHSLATLPAKFKARLSALVEAAKAGSFKRG